MLIPYSTEVVLTKWPIGNLALIFTCITVFVLVIAEAIPEPVLEVLILQGWSPLGLLGYQFLHGGLFHLSFNMLYLWVFGNAVCEKLGSFRYGMVYLLTGILAGVLHNVMADTPAIGASGAINGVIGMYLVLYPVNRVHCFYWYFARIGTFDIPGFWLILFWFIGDAWQAYRGASTGIAYWAHIGGFVSGLGLGTLLLATRVVQMAPYDNPTLLEYLGWRREGPSHWPSRRGELVRSRSLQRTRRSEPSHSTPPSPRGPAPEQFISVPCPHCSKPLQIPRTKIGSTFPCPACHGWIELREE